MCCLFVTSCILTLYSVQVTLIGLAASLFWQGSCKYNYKFSFIFKCVCSYFCVFITFVSLFIAFIIVGLLMYYGRFLSEIKQLIDWLIEQCLTSLPTQYRLHGRRCVFCTIVINNINDNNHNNMTVCQRQTAQTDICARVFSYPFFICQLCVYPANSFCGISRWRARYSWVMLIQPRLEQDSINQPADHTAADRKTAKYADLRA